MVESPFRLNGKSVTREEWLADITRHLRRNLPAASDRDRIAAARYAAEQLAIRLNVLSLKRKDVWSHYADSDGQIVSVNQ